MALIPRLLGLESPKIGVHAFFSAVGEQERGKLTRAQVLSTFGIGAAEEAVFDSLTAKIKPVRDAYPLSGRVVLTNVGAAYDTNADSQSLPFVYVERAGVTRIDIEIRNRKAATQTGTIDYQLWDETNGVPVIETRSGNVTANTTGSITDSQAAGDHTLNASRAFATALSAQVVKLRLRVLCSTAADDPTFLQAAILLFRDGTLTSDVMHQIFLLGETGAAQYDTESEILARLGI